MDKYQKLWEYVVKQDQDQLDLTFEQVNDIAGVPMDHSFLQYKKNLLPLGFKVEHIYMKKGIVSFERVR